MRPLFGTGQLQRVIDADAAALADAGTYFPSPMLSE
jgi:hypothetical protein